MIVIRKSSERGHVDHGWLESYHTFSFSSYHDPRHMGFRSLRVINEDRVKPGEGFGTHPHRDMEIITYVLQGALEHKDSMKNGSVIQPGDIQRMSAGTGVTHSEYNHSKEELVHFLQIWILPKKAGIKPSYEQKHFPLDSRLGKLKLLASEDGREGSVLVHQDVNLYGSVLSPKMELEYRQPKNRHAWVHVAGGSVLLDEFALGPGDAAAISGEHELKILAEKQSEILIFDLA